MYRFKMRFLLGFCATFAFAMTCAVAAPTVRVLGKTTPSIPTNQPIKSHTVDNNTAVVRSSSNRSRVMATNRIKPAATTTSARISTISLPKIVDVTNKPKVDPAVVQPTPEPQNFYTKQEIDQFFNEISDDFEGDVNACIDWYSEAPCDGRVDVNVRYNKKD